MAEASIEGPCCATCYALGQVVGYCPRCGDPWVAHAEVGPGLLLPTTGWIWHGGREHVPPACPECLPDRYEWLEVLDVDEGAQLADD